MKRRLFEDLVVSSPAAFGREARTLPVSFLIHASGFAAAFLLPLWTTSDLPVVPRDYVPVVWAAPPPPPPAPPLGNPGRPSQAQRTRAVPAPGPAPLPSDRLAPPPAELPMIAGTGDVDVDLPGLETCEGCAPWGEHGGVPYSVGDGPPSTDPPVVVVTAGGKITPPVKLREVAPVYPELAKAARVEGAVVLECVINPEGRVIGAQVLKGHALLTAAAVTAVQQWVYRPTLLNGQPVSVVMTVTVRFTLNW